MTASPINSLTAAAFVKKIRACRSPEVRAQLSRYFKTGPGEYAEGDVFIGVRMSQVFALAREFIDLPLGEIDKLLQSPIHEVRAGGLSIMDKQARRKRTPESRRKELYQLYLKRMDRINNWDLVDVSAPHVIGGYLFDKPKDILYRLARSKNVWARRSAIVSTGFFVRKGEVAHTFRIAELLLADRHDLIHKATGWLLREAGRKDRSGLLSFLDRHAATMPRTALRYSMEHLTKPERDHYLGLKKRTRLLESLHRVTNS